MRLTYSGWTVLVILVGAVALSWQHGPRALNAVVTPLVVVFVTGVILTARVDRPTVHRQRVSDGSVGETRTVECRLECGGTVSADILETVGDGLSVSTADGETSQETDVAVSTTIDGEARLAYDIELEERGERVVGPITITVSDVFGLMTRTFTYTETTTVLVYPSVSELHSESAGDLQAIENAAGTPEREEFDHLREYHRGDSLRDVHWKSAAKRPGDELVVTEYRDEGAAGSVTIAAECEDNSEQFARAVASIATYLLERDRRVGLTVDGHHLEPGSDRSHRRELLGILAVATGEELTERDRNAADIVITGDWREMQVVTDERTIPFPRLIHPRERARAPGWSEGQTDRSSESGVIA
ncbi:DUF58 domain-containing protein [Natronolimnobius baerhuensis]|uniref:DUF58 domain-containing protein n=1 Tax=Natronolimnobius baerhuensis TaxID=253108 RepID=A0A202EA18_9EURY|nr:DUF58 domain-containing protein [Natronolimnobius baerhuensis]OVE85133.1 DUF58 domain-containing protein [Natronolimnobius baerhuensis]